MSTRLPAALVLDSYGTLLDWTQVAGALSGIVAEPHRFTALWRRKQLEYTWLATVAERFEPLPEITKRALRYTAEIYETEIPERLQRELVDAWTTVPLYPDAASALPRLAAKVPLVALTNDTNASAKKAFEHAHVLPLFKHVFTAEHASAYKPSPRVYALPLAALGVGRESVLYVTGDAWDAAGAQLFGYRVCWIARHDETCEKLAGRPELVVRQMGELVDALGATAREAA